MKNLGQMLKQAQEFQSKMSGMQEELLDMEVSGSSGGGMVRVTLNGKGEARKIKIDPSLVTPEDAQVLEDLILAAFNDAKGKIETMMQEKMGELTGGMGLPPGFKLPF
ncbi:MAG: YbaB/EbfC family nucleoid-associated protein [Alphaproteobacteria bacterium]|jgi:nucleoid-associated protein EbfC|nr:YbaB/EbfC family nucleoid-associated protein [Alphaproteobacteria bacterium]MBT7942876.1 YbaB/EbfC family nucleoid-associated protein [Alphaproteobacteria bacterium]